MKKLRKTFIRGMVMDFVCASPCAHQIGSVRVRRRSFWGGSAVYLEKMRSLERIWYRKLLCCTNKYAPSYPTTAIALRSVRIPEFSKLNSWEPLANDFLRERITHIGEQSDLHKLYPVPFFSYKFLPGSEKSLISPEECYRILPSSQEAAYPRSPASPRIPPE